MSAERKPDLCAAQRANLLRQMYGDEHEPAAELRAHLASCTTCRKALVAAQHMHAALRAALHPEALSEQALWSFQQRLATKPTRRWRTRTHLYRLAGTAVAAGLAGALLLPWWWHSSASRGAPRSPQGALALSSEDAAALLAVYTRFGWEGTTETALHLLADEVSGVSRSVQRAAGAETFLPWTSENDWDLPAGDRGVRRTPAAAPRGGRAALRVATAGRVQLGLS